MNPLSHPALASAPRLDQLLGLLSLGAGTRQIMAEMCITRRVVSNYVARIADRLEVPPEMRRRGCVRYAIVRIAERHAALREAREAASAAIEQLAV